LLERPKIWFNTISIENKGNVNELISQPGLRASAAGFWLRLLLFLRRLLTFKTTIVSQSAPALAFAPVNEHLAVGGQGAFGLLAFAPSDGIEVAHWTNGQRPVSLTTKATAAFFMQ